MTNRHGLTTFEAEKNIKEYGLNIFYKEKKESILKIIIQQFNDSTIYLLLIASFLSILLKEYIDAVIIFVVLLINTSIGTIQEYKAKKALESLKNLSTPVAKVLRDNKLVTIDVTKVTIDDIVILEEGDIVPADLILLESNILKIDESLLTGESLPIEKKVGDIGKQQLSLGDKFNHAFASTKVIQGNGIGRVIGVGKDTEIGKIAGMLNKNDKELTPLQIKLDKTSKFLGIFTIVLAIFVFIVGLLLHFNALEILVFSISLAVAAIPEGLIAVVTIVLSMGVKKMVKNNAIVRKLNAVETLGSVEIVCSDKTGTITKNELEVKEVFSYLENKTILYKSFFYCNNVKNNIGDPLELALLKFLENNKDFGLKSHLRIKEYPFSSERKMMSVLIEEDNKKMLFSKGAFEILIEKCNRIYYGNKIIRLEGKVIDKIKEKILELENKAYRVLAFAYGEKDIEEELIFLGVVGFIDPPRENIKEAIIKLKKAGITPIMITGDHKNTAYSIGKEIGIIENIDECIEGKELDELINERKSLDKYKVFSRVNPSHKVDIVKYFKECNKVVAMTGDGVNDAPALKKADVGIAMGKGSEVAKESGDIVLVDNNFETIEKAIEEGRNIFTNIKKAVLFLLSSNLGEVLSVLIFLLLKFPLPLLSIHILWVNLISDSLPALALGNDNKYQDIMGDKPRKKDESLFARNGLFVIVFYGVIIFILTSIGFLILPITNLINLGLNVNYSNVKYMLDNQDILLRSRTYAFTILGISQLFHMIGMSNIKESFINIIKNHNWWRLIAFVIGFSLQILVTEFTPLINIFKTVQLSFKEWIYLILVSTIPLIFHEILRKSYRNNL